MENTNKKSHKGLIISLILLLLIGIIVLCCFLLLGGSKDDDSNGSGTSSREGKSEYRLTGNNIEDFDLYFLKHENPEKNIIYSPLSIKYALKMLEEGSNGETDEQIADIVGDYKAKKYENNANMSFANALFIKDEFASGIEETYKSALKSRYNAEVQTDSFATPDNLNKWVSDKTFGLIKNLFDDVSDKDFILVNALAIDMEWVNKFKDDYKSYSQTFAHENFYSYVNSLSGGGYETLDFNGVKNAKAVDFKAVANKYDIVKELGEDNIKNTVRTEYNKFLANGGCGGGELSTDAYLDQYMKEIKQNYNVVSSSTDFMFYNNDDIKVYAKDLKTYGSTTLQYIGIMPKNEKLSEYLKTINSKKLSEIIGELKEVKLENFKEGVVTEIKATIPLFKYDYTLDLVEDLKSLGITNAFDKDKADLSKISSFKEYIGDASHKATIEFSNTGIKASAATMMGGMGAGGCEFDYTYDVPVETIDMTFDKPFMYIIRDKNTKEVWFVGAVYEPIIYSPNYSSGMVE